MDSWLQVICWVLGEYGTADGKFSASYVAGKLCDVADAYSNDETVKVSINFWCILVHLRLVIVLHVNC